MFQFKKGKFLFQIAPPGVNNIVLGCIIIFQGILFSSKDIVSFDVGLLILYFLVPILASLVIVMVLLKINNYFNVIGSLILAVQTLIILAVNYTSLGLTIIFILFCHVPIRLIEYVELSSRELSSQKSHRDNNDEKNDCN